ncbi:MAG: FAD binding domain-containing protein [Candidatus Cryosericum sp.]
MGRIVEYYRAGSVEDAVATARRLGSSAAYVGGGVELVLRRNPEISTLIDLSQCGLGEILEVDDGIEVGSQVTLAAISRSTVLKHYAGGSLALWSGRIAQNNLRNMITVGGSIGRNQPWNDLVPHLIALDAEVRFFDGAQHRAPLVSYINAKRTGAVIEGVVLPSGNANAKGFMWRFTRTQQDVSLLHCSALIDAAGGVINKANIVFAGRPGHAALYPQLGQELTNGGSSQDLFEGLAKSAVQAVEVETDHRATAEYRRDLVRAAIINLGDWMTGDAQ